MASFELQIDKQFYKDLKRIDKKQASRVYQAVIKLQNNPDPAAAKQLKGTSLRRLRVGDYRVLYEIEKKKVVIRVLRALHRKEAYRKL
ncbi:MAG: type II toxin-antitoxin system RelE family toxin [Candidatus Saccharimonadales bacterium]